MNVYTTYRDIDNEQWQQLVDSSSVASWFQTPEAYDFYASVPSQMTPFAFAVSRGENLKGVVVGYVTQERNFLKQYFTRRAIIVGGPLLAEDITDDELKAMLGAVVSFTLRKAIYTETRNFCDYSRWRTVFEQCGFAYKPQFDMHITCSDRSMMESRVNDSKMRRIRRAIDEGVEIVEATSETEVVEFYQLLCRLYKEKIHKPLFDLIFFTTFVADKKGVLLLARHGGTIIGGMLCPFLTGKTLYEWYVVGPPIVTWAAMDYANRHNLPLFDLMGAGEPGKHYGVRDFKLQFGGELKEFGRFLRVNNRLLYSLGSLGLRLL